MAPGCRNNWLTHLIAHFPVPAKKGITLNAEHPALPNDLFICCSLDHEQVEAQLFTFALGQLANHSQRLTLQLTFGDVLPDRNADDQFARLDKAHKRLLQPLKYEGSTEQVFQPPHSPVH
jgi:hypothetical protein